MVPMLNSPWTFSVKNFNFGIIAQFGFSGLNWSKYMFNSDSTKHEKSTSLSIGKVDTGTGNSIKGIFSSGKTPPVTSTIKYIYSNNSVTLGSNLTIASYGDSSAGNSIKGIFSHGVGNSSASLNSTDKYTYNNDSVSSSSNLGSSVAYRSATGNSVEGVFSQGTSDPGPASGTGAIYVIGTTYKYRYSNDSTTTGVNLAPAWRGAATGNSIVGIFAAINTGRVDLSIMPYHYTFTNSTQKYIYSSNSIISGTSLEGTPNYKTAMGNFEKGIFGQAVGAGQSNKYMYANDTVTSVTGFLGEAAVSADLQGVNL